MGAITTLKQNNKPWTLTWKASGRYPIVADRIFDKLEDAQAYVDDTTATASATGGLIISVINDEVAKNNGVYYVKSVANTDPKYGALLDKGTLVKVGGAETETADTYSEAVTLSQTLVTGQLIKVSEDETITVGDSDSDSDEITVTYKAGFYMVETPGTIFALGNADDVAHLTDELGTLKGRVDVDIQKLNDLLDDYSGTLGDVDDRLMGLEAFVEAHESIDLSVIEGLFADSDGSDE